MNWFKSLSISRKLLAITVATSLAALLPAAVGFVAIQVIQASRNLQASATSTAQILAENMAAALTFDDAPVASEVLASLRTEPNVVAGCVYKSNDLFAYYYAAQGDATCPKQPPPDGAVFSGRYMSVGAPVSMKEQRIGTIYLTATLDPVYQALRLGGVLIAVILFISSAISFLLSSRLQRFISDPIVKLAGAARLVSERADYSVRVPQGSDDELGKLVSTFNEMLAQIETRDSQLLESKSHLEERVEDRTRELQQRNTELDRSNRDLDDFAYVASHDLKEPLRGIHNYSSFLIEDYADKLDPEGQSRLQALMRLTKRMESIIDSLLECSRVGRANLTPKPVNMEGLLADVLDSLEIVIAEQNIEIRRPAPLPETACDPVWTAEIFRNLIVNAMKYNTNPDKWIEISSNKQDGITVFYVRDNGIGIPERHQNSVFQIFKRLHARDKYGGGSGAGLTIVKKIVERHGGRIWIESTVGQGSTFHFTLTGR